jgi:hypothetical protein
MFDRPRVLIPLLRYHTEPYYVQYDSEVIQYAIKRLYFHCLVIDIYGLTYCNRTDLSCYTHFISMREVYLLKLILSYAVFDFFCLFRSAETEKRKEKRDPRNQSF